MELKLNGAVAIVTGASSGIGAATAQRPAKEGASVAVLARREDRLDTLVAGIEKSGGTALAVQSGITDRMQAESAVQTVIDRFGRLDILGQQCGPHAAGAYRWRRGRGMGADARHQRAGLAVHDQCGTATSAECRGQWPAWRR